MKILNLAVEDMAGAAYTLSQAINQNTKNHAVNITLSNNYINYPTMANGKYYTSEAIQKIIDAADTIVFHTAIVPYMSAFNLTKEKLKNKKCLLYFHGTDCRHYGKKIVEQANEALSNYEVLVSTPDLLEFMPQAVWMPVARSFKDIKQKYSVSPRDQKALNALNAQQTKVTLGHAPTNPERKGSPIFLRVMTKLIMNDPKVEKNEIVHVTWDQCLSMMRDVDIFFDQCVIGAYGLASVEASIFRAAVFCKLSTQVLEAIKKETGFNNPFIQWETEEELLERAYALVYKPKIRRRFGKNAYDYCQAVHDYKPVAAKFLKVVEDM
jgi:hypothetical protein